MIKKGNGLLLKLNYADGEICIKKRTFLVIDKIDGMLYLLNVSSINGKSHKVGFRSNKQINRFRPPFIKASMVKCDALYVVPEDILLEQFRLDNGRAINPIELQEIMEYYQNYREDIGNCFNSVTYNLNDIMDMNELSVALV